MSHPRIIFEDDFLLVLDKPSPMIVNRADTSSHELTLQDWVEKELKIKNLSWKNEESDFIKRSGIVHRLDKETSGLIIVAKDGETFSALQKEFKEGRVEKTYCALAHGKVQTEGEIKLPIGRLPWNRMRFGVFPQGRESRTLYRCLGYRIFKHDKKQEIVSLLEVYPKTGRTHQIRVHLQHIGHPIFADALYAGRKTIKVDREFVPRHFLHAQKISFMHPQSHERIELVSKLPSELESFLKTIEIYHG